MHPADGAGVSVDVQDKLLETRTRMRQSGVVPYPLEYSRDLIVYDGWNTTFTSTLCTGLFPPDALPARVLDLGCGDGQWLLEHAKEWPTSHLIGFDMAEIQPDLSRKDFQQSAGIQDIVPRITLVHGNFLDPLPFPTDYFDFVHISCIGLGVPEDEWQDLLEEVTRVLVPGGMLQLIEEDLIFPCGSSTRKRTDLLETPLVLQNIAGSSVPSLVGSQSTSSTSTSSRRLSLLSKRPGSPLELTRPPASASLDSAHSPIGPLRADIEELLDPQDHGKLRRAWQEMLARRFLAPRLLSVLPFYLSQFFEDIRAYPALQVPLPPNTQHGADALSSPWDSGIDLSSLSEYFSDNLKQHAVRMSSEAGETVSSPRARENASAAIAQWAPLHLARAVAMVRACRNAIWTEYKELLVEDDMSGPQAILRRKHEEFEAAWANWENDMKDRMSMRNRLSGALGWQEPAGERPDWSLWRERVGDVEVETDTESIDSQMNLCRSVRGFLARKPAAPVEPTCV